MISSRRFAAIAATAVVVAVPSSAQAMRSSDGPAPSSAPVRAAVHHPPVIHAVTRPAARGGASASPGGFRWDDAGLGAAGMLVILGSTSLAARRRRPHRAIAG